MDHGSAVLNDGGMHGLVEPAWEEPGQRPGRLPTSAARFLEDLRLDAEQAEEATSNAHRLFMEERQERQRTRARIADLDKDNRIRRDDRVYVTAVRTLEAQTERTGKMEERYARLSERSSALRALVTRIDDWHGDRSGDMIEAHAGSAPKLARGEKPLDAVARLRGKVAELRQEATRISNAPLPAAEAKAAAKSFIEHMAFSGRPDVTPLLRGESKPEWPNLASLYQQAVMGPGNEYMVIAAGVNADAIGLTAWLHGPAMLKALEAQIDAEAKDDRAIPTVGREARLDVLRGEMLAIEREEEAIIRAIAEEGIPVERRPDADPRAVLAVVVRETA